jgi:hypothetical protein
VTDGNQRRCATFPIKGRIVLRIILCVGLLGSATTVFLGHDTVISVVAVIVFGVCLAMAGFRSLRRASRRIDGLLAEELGSAQGNAEHAEPFSDSWRRTA